MRLFSLAFLLGVCSIFYFSAVPNLYLLFGLTVIAIVVYFIFRNRCSLLLLALCLGLTLVMSTAHIQLEKRLPKTMEGKTLLVTGEIVSLPQYQNKKTDFLFKVYSVQPPHVIARPVKIKLNWYGAPNPLNPGDAWQLQVRLKRPHGVRNPGSLDYEKWLFRRNISATGYVVSSVNNQLLDSYWYHRSINRLRQFIKEKIYQSLQTESLRAFIPALVIGDRQDITQKQWQVFRRTGTSHLIAISGLHVGLIVGFIFLLTHFIWRCIPFLTLHLPAKQAAAGISLLAAYFYAALAGFSLSTQRALVMSTVMLSAILLKRYVTAWSGFSLALLIVLLFDPLSVLDAGFWLSFFCVAVIIYGMQGRWQRGGLWWQWGRVQWVVAIGLCPLLLWTFHEVSLVTPIANLVAVPVFGFVILPLSMLGVALTFLNETLGSWVLMCAIKSLQIIWIILQKVAQLPFITLQHAIPNIWILGFTMIAVIILLAPKGIPRRYLSVIFLLPLVTAQPKQPKNGEIWFTLFDVGQGLSSIVQTQHHTLVFDAGPGHSDGFNAGAAIVLPYIQLNGLHQIDKLMISHGDNDHIGGADSIISNTHVEEILSSVPKQFSVRANYCRYGQHWQWDDVEFEMLSPNHGGYRQGNNSSCVLKITTGNQSILLPGDIEEPIEKALLQDGVDLKSTVLVAPHHGSKTSSSWQFVQAVHPKFILFSVGYRNRFRFPHKSIIRRYERIDAARYDTARSGAVHFKVMPNKISPPELYREKNRHIWSD